MARSESEQPNLSGMKPVEPPVAPPVVAPGLPVFPASPNPLLRSPLPADQQLQPDTLRQFYQRGTSQYRVLPLPNAAKPTINSTAKSVAKVIVTQSTPPATTNVYDVIWSLPGVPISNTTYLVIPFRLNVSCLINFGSSAGRCLTNPTATATFTLKKLTAGGVTSTIGTFVISTTGAFTFTSAGGIAQGFAIGDSLLITTPSVSDATLSDVAVTIAGTRQ